MVPECWNCDAAEEEFLTGPARGSNGESEVRMVGGSNEGPSRSEYKGRILFQNRPNAFTQRGGDTVVMERYASGLKARGYEVIIDCEGKEDPAQYSLVHLFNAALPDMLKRFAQRVKDAGVPYVVTTLYEDIRSFHNRSATMAQALIQYCQAGQSPDWWNAHRPNLAAISACSNFPNEWVFRNAAALLTTGRYESAVILNDYPGLANIVELPLGYEVGAEGNAEDFIKKYGLRDFILCVGRIESRKNQLMLLKALEQSDLPVVLIGGGFSYQPDYDRAVRSFRRKGTTIVLDRVTPEELSAAYAACRVHVLASWHELPGLVTLEAAAYGKNVVLTESGTGSDYVGADAFYCDPASEHSIRTAVMGAYHAPVPMNLRSKVRRFSWEHAAEKLAECYASILPQVQPTTVAMTSNAAVGGYDFAEGVEEWQEILERGEAAARAGEHTAAEQWLSRAWKENPSSGRTARALAALHFSQQRSAEAKQWFERAVQLEPQDARALVGLGMCFMSEGNWEQASAQYSRALEIDPEQIIGLRNLVECAFQLQQFDVLEGALRRYLDRHSEDVEMKFCLAGCRFKQGDMREASSLAREILAKKPEYQGALDLVAQIGKQPVLESVPVASKAQPGEFSKHDERIAILEDAKRGQRYAEVHRGVTEVLAEVAHGTESWERAMVLDADAYALEGRLEEARKIYEQVLSVNPRSPFGLCGSGVLKATAERWEEARECFERALTAYPQYDVALAGLGFCAGRKGDKEGAWNWYRKALQSNPENTRALLGVIEFGYPLQRLDEVQRALEQYLEMHPADLDFLYALAGCYFAQQKLDEAKSEISKIMLFAPEHESARELRSLIAEVEDQGKQVAAR